MDAKVITPHWAGIAQMVGRTLYGEPSRETPHEWRWSRSGKTVKGGSLKLDLVNGVFYDFQRRQGGGVMRWLQTEGETMSDMESMQWLADRGLVDVAPEGAETRKATGPAERNADTHHRMQTMLICGIAINDDDAAPARLWLANKIPTWQGAPPKGMMYIPSGVHLQNAFGSWAAQDGMAGVICAALWTIDEWEYAYRENRRKPVHAVQCIGIRADGSQVVDSKRSLGERRDGVFLCAQQDSIIADTSASRDMYTIGMAEGIADAIAVASMVDIPCVATIGMPSPNAAYIDALLGFGGVNIYADAEGNKTNPKTGAVIAGGMAAASAVMHELNFCAGGDFAKVFVVREGKDAAELSQTINPSSAPMETVNDLYAERDRILASGDTSAARELLVIADGMGYGYDKNTGSFVDKSTGEYAPKAI